MYTSFYYLIPVVLISVQDNVAMEARTSKDELPEPKGL